GRQERQDRRLDRPDSRRRVREAARRPSAIPGRHRKEGGRPACQPGDAVRAREKGLKRRPPALLTVGPGSLTRSFVSERGWPSLAVTEASHTIAIVWLEIGRAHV